MGMLAILSPAKNMRPVSLPDIPLSRPFYIQDAKRLAGWLSAYSAWELESLFRVNPSIAMRAFLDYQEFDGEKEGYPALLSYHGLAYRHIGAGDFSREDWMFAQRHIRLLSALYGVLLPCDGILPYRLEFLCRFQPQGNSLYAYWGDRIYRRLMSEGDTVINLASGEYAKTVEPFLRGEDRYITCDFLTQKRGSLSMPAALAKMARGEMARFLVRERVETPEGLKGFQWDGYRYSEILSSKNRYVFVRG